MKQEIMKYIFAFFTAVSHVLINSFVIYSESLLNNNYSVSAMDEMYFKEELYLIPLFFALVQICIELCRKLYNDLEFH